MCAEVKSVQTVWFSRWKIIKTLKLQHFTEIENKLMGESCWVMSGLQVQSLMFNYCIAWTFLSLLNCSPLFSALFTKCNKPLPFSFLFWPSKFNASHQKFFKQTGFNCNFGPKSETFQSSKNNIQFRLKDTLVIRLDQITEFKDIASRRPN